jgi:hypothetical protein
MNNLIKKSIKDKNGFWTDYYTEDNTFIIAQGYDEWERSKGRPWGLFKNISDHKWQVIGYYSSVEDAFSNIPIEAPKQESTKLVELTPV